MAASAERTSAILSSDFRGSFGRRSSRAERESLHQSATAGLSHEQHRRTRVLELCSCQTVSCRWSDCAKLVLRKSSSGPRASPFSSRDSQAILRSFRRTYGQRMQRILRIACSYPLCPVPQRARVARPPNLLHLASLGEKFHRAMRSFSLACMGFIRSCARLRCCRAQRYIASPALLTSSSLHSFVSLTWRWLSDCDSKTLARI